MPDPVPPEPAWAHCESIRVRYQEVDMQQVVFNAHYLTYCDEAIAGWMRAAIGWTGADDVIDWMLVKATLEWQGSATYGEVVDLSCGVGRWGTTSFDVAFRGLVGERPVFTASITYVCIEPGTKAKLAVPDDVRAALGPARTGTQEIGRAGA
ncbi:MAG: thioesterase [Acidimicrobiales bacterium]|nr:thioesterase [Acidimicrobiales bacterium]